MTSRSKLMPAHFTPVGGAYSHGLAVDVENARFVFLTGQLAIDAESNVVGLGDVLKQTAFVVSNVERILSEAEATLTDVVKAQLFLAPPAELDDVPAVLEFLERRLAAVTVLMVSALAREGCCVELEVTACSMTGQTFLEKEQPCPTSM